MTEVIDLFAGPGGWDVAAHSLGMAPLGIEWDANACATRKAAGLRTMQGDVAALTPTDFGPVHGLIASPPCQSFSMAGKRGGEQDTEHVIACAHELAAGADTRAEHRAKCVDERSMLVVEPVRWVRDLRPRWVALEQVPPVIELWGLFAHLMESWGYRTWTGVLSAERYGVPQTRKRAILLASLDGQPHPPEATHQAYVPGEPQRHDVSMFGEVLPWVSMAQALGWHDGQDVNTRGDRQTPGGNEFSADKPSWALTEKTRSWRVQTNNFTAVARDPDGGRSKAGSVPYERPTDAPSPTVDGSAGGWQLRAGTNAHDVARPACTPAPTMRFSERMNDVSWVMRASAQEKTAIRREDEPAPTIIGGHGTGERVWQPTHYDCRQTGAQPRSTEDPAPTIASQGLSKGRDVWKMAKKEDRLERREQGAGNRPRPVTKPSAVLDQRTDLAQWTTEDHWQRGDAIRVTTQEASILQSFPPDYPWQGSRSAQFQQIGNAVPPLMARAILQSIAGDQAQGEKAA